MNLVDVILVLVVVMAMWAGWQRGFIMGVINLLTWIGSLVAGFLFYPTLAPLLAAWFPALGVWLVPLAFILVILLARMLLAWIFNSFLQSTPEGAHRSLFNKIMGLVPGFASGLVYATLISALLLALPLSDAVSATTRDSRIASGLALQAEWVDDRFDPIFGEAARQTMNRLTVEPDSEETVQLKFKVSNGKTRPDLEAEMLALVNQERTKRGLRPVQADPEMQQVARAHSQDMFARGYFSHYTPEGRDPFDRMKAAGVKFKAAGENLALGQTLRICHTGLMNSPGHRANILNPKFGRLGIGVIDGGLHGLMISQEFRD